MHEYWGGVFPLRLWVAANIILLIIGGAGSSATCGDSIGCNVAKVLGLPLHTCASTGLILYTRLHQFAKGLATCACSSRRRKLGPRPVVLTCIRFSLKYSNTRE